jgi:DNA-binding MarR family transcriptional regulator
MKRQTWDKTAGELPMDACFNCVGYRVRSLSRVVSAIYDEALGPLKLKISQFTILVILDRSGALSAADLCKLLMMDKSTASRNLQRMRRRGWISVVRDDGSGQKLSLAREGAQILRNAYPLWRTAQKEATRRLRADGLRALDRVLVRIKS